MLKKRLFTPGPTSIPESVLLDMAQPVMHHRTEEFLAIAAEVFTNLKYVFQTRHDVFILAASGTGAMEASVVNLLSRGDRALVVSGGKFGERWIELVKAYGVEATVIDLPWGKRLDPAVVAEALRKQPDIKAVFCTLCETSTGTHCDIQALGKIVAERPDTVLVVDAISSLGAVPCLTDAWGLDIVVTGSQKALMLPPGLACMSVSPKAWGLIERSTLPKYYFNLKKYRKALEKSDFPFTMAVSLVIGLNRALGMLRTATMEKVWAEHHQRAEATRRACVKMGLKLFSEAPSDGVTAVLLPEGMDGEKLVKHLRKQYGISVAGGQDSLKGKIVRISHLGWQDAFDTLTAIAAVAAGLRELGSPVSLEAGMKEASDVLFTAG